MALTISIEGKGSIAIADTGTETWGEYGSTLGIVDETDIFLQGTSAVSTKASGKAGWLYFDIGSGNELDFSASGTEEDQLLYIWFNVTTLGGLNTLANRGIAVQVGSSTTNADYWVIGGSDGVGNGYTGGWMCAVIDVSNVSRTGYTGTGLTKSSARYFGIYIDNTGSAKAENLIIDQIAVGDGLRITGTDATGWQEVADYCNDFTNRAWGMMQEREGIYYIYGHLYLGDSTQTAATSMTDSGRVFRFGDFEYYTGSAWATAIIDGNNGITIEDASGYATTLEDGTIVGTDKGRGGSVFIGSASTDTTLDLYGGSEATSVTKLYGSTCDGISGGVNFGNDSDHHCYSVTFNDCAQVDPVGAVKIRNCVFSGYTPDTDGALLWNGSIDIRSCVFAGNTDGTNDPHAIEHPAGGTFSYYGLVFSGNDYDINFSASSGTLTINNLKENGVLSDASTYEITNGATSVTINTSVDIIINTIDSGNNPIANVRCAIYKSSDDSELMNEDSTALGVASESITYPGSPFDIYWRVRESPAAGSRYKATSGFGSVNADGYVATVRMEPETVS